MSSKTKGIKKTYPKKRAASKKYKKRSLMFKDANKRPRIEKKWVDIVNTLTCPIGSAFVVTPLQLNPTAGSTGTNGARLGAAIEMKSLLVRCNALWPGNQSVNAPGQVRYVVVYDKQSNGAAPGRSDVFADGTNWASPINLFNQDRFIVLADEISEQCTNGQFCVGTEIFRKMDLEAVWPSGGSAYPNTGGVSIWVAAVSDLNDATAAHFPQVQIYSRMRYTDA